MVDDPKQSTKAVRLIRVGVRLVLRDKSSVANRGASNSSENRRDSDSSEREQEDLP